MATIKELRKELVELRKFLVGQKAGLARSKPDGDGSWLKYAIESSDKVRGKVSKVIEMLDVIIG
ncbi:hypothetical protein ES707_06710 [subsurface metagenome]